MAKKWYTSKTIWFNVGTTLVAVANELMPILQLMDGETTELVRAFLIIALSVGNLILRLVTTKPVKF